MDYAHWWGAHSYWFWIVPLVVMVLMFALASYMIRRGGVCRWVAGNRNAWGPFGCCGSRRDATPRQILDRRYARGEITNEQYEEIKHDIERRDHGE